MSYSASALGFQGLGVGVFVPRSSDRGACLKAELQKAAGWARRSPDAWHQLLCVTCLGFYPGVCLRLAGAVAVPAVPVMPADTHPYRGRALADWGKKRGVKTVVVIRANTCRFSPESRMGLSWAAC